MKDRVSFPKIYQQQNSIVVVRDISPRLASWEHKQHRDQIRLRSYLDNLYSPVEKLLIGQKSLFLDLRIDVGDKQKLIRQHDVENYLTPLFGTNWFDHQQFPLVSGSKHVGGGSILTIGTVSAVDSTMIDDSWCHLSVNAGKSPTQKSWKQRLNEAVEKSRPQMIASEHQVEFHMAWRCATRRNWVLLWKPTGDALSPILGYTGTNKYNPYDDRITSLTLHRICDDSIGHDVHVGLWWKTVPIHH